MLDDDEEVEEVPVDDDVTDAEELVPELLEMVPVVDVADAVPAEDDVPVVDEEVAVPDVDDDEEALELPDDDDDDDDDDDEADDDEEESLEASPVVVRVQARDIEHRATRRVAGILMRFSIWGHSTDTAAQANGNPPRECDDGHTGITPHAHRVRAHHFHKKLVYCETVQSQP